MSEQSEHAQDAAPDDVALEAEHAAEDEARSAPRAPRWRRLRALNWGGWLVALGLGMLFGALFFSGAGASTSSDHAHKHDEQAAQAWTCSMHPEIRSAEPGLCPICGMELIPASDAAALGPEEVMLDERAKALLRLRVQEVTVAQDAQPARWLLAKVTTDERQERTITAWTGGRVERLKVATTGQRVGKGQVVMEIFSPELYAAHKDLIAAGEQLERLLASGAEPFVLSPARAAVASSEQRLRLLGVTDAELVQLKKSKTPWTRVPQRAPFNGTVMQRMVEAGQYVQTGTPLLKIANLEEVWAELEAYEADLPSLELEQRVELTLSALPGELFTGKISFIDPVIDPKTRTAQVRVELENKGGRLKPGMYGSARVLDAGLKPGESPPLLIPQTAPLYAGRRSLVYVERQGNGGPVYEAKEVVLGPKRGEFYTVVAGLKRGERVVTHGAFVLDADLQLRGGLSLMRRADDDLAANEAASGEVEPLVGVSARFMEGLRPVMVAYLDAQEALAADDLARSQRAAARLEEAVKALIAQDGEVAAVAWGALKPGLLRDSAALASAAQLGAARERFKSVTASIKVALSRFGNPLEDQLSVAYCPMAFDNQGAEWIQRAQEVDNVYFGDAMRRCGEIRDTLPAGAHLLMRRGQ